MPNKFSQRSSDLELMDGPIERKSELFTNLRELELINRLTGGPALGFGALKQLLAKQTQEIHIVDIGFGAGDMLQYLLDHAHELPCPIKITGVDLMPEATEYALAAHPQLHNKVNLVTMNYKDWFAAENKADVVLASLFCHHLSDADVSGFMADIQKNARIGGIINDLHRAPVAYYFIKMATQLLSKSRFTKNDAPLSVLRGFSKEELVSMLEKADIQQYRVQWKWAFRYLVSIRNHG